MEYDDGIKAGDWLKDGGDDGFVGSNDGYTYENTLIGIVIVVVFLVIWLYAIKPSMEGMCGLIDESHLSNCLYYQQPYGTLRSENNASNSILS
jgi:hypothetical protein